MTCLPASLPHVHGEQRQAASASRSIDSKYRARSAETGKETVTL
jgi:hypothetical protein